MTPEETRKIAEEAAEAALGKARILSADEIKEIVSATVRETLLNIGMQTDSPSAIQESRADFKHLRDWRLSVDKAKSVTFSTALAIIVTGILGAFFLGMSQYFQKP